MTPEFAYSRLPDDVKKNYPKFARFIKDYYTWCLTQGFNGIIENYKSLLYQKAYSIDYDQRQIIGFGLDITLASDTTIHGELLYKLINEFLESRGSITSYEILFRMLYNKQVTIEFPRDKLATTSNSKYLRTTRFFMTGNYPINMYSKIKGLRSGLTTSIESYIPFYIGQSRYYLVECNNIYDSFTVGEPLEITTIDDVVYNEVHYPLIGLNINNAGRYYQKGDKIIPSSNMMDGYFEITKVSKGSVDDIIINNGGTGYIVGDKIKIPDSLHFDAVISAVDNNGSVTAISLKNGGYYLTKIPKTFTSSSAHGTGLKLTFSSSTIGNVLEINVNEGGHVFNTSAISYTVLSADGENLHVTSKVVPHYRINRYVDKKGFLGYNAIVLDSYTKHSHSYDIISNVPGSKYNAIAEKYCNPTGYVYNQIFTITNTIDVNIEVLSELIRK